MRSTAASDVYRDSLRVAACAHRDERLTPFYPQMVREVTREDILRLMEIRMARILKFNKDKADELIPQ